MKPVLPLLLFCCSCLGLTAQTSFVPDTILRQTFTVDPSDTMIIFPNGNDTHWVNWDADNMETWCGDDGETIPGNWYWEGDFGDLNSPPLNSAFTSCSYFPDPNVANENWLITPPVFVPDSNTVLQWRSSSFQGPGFLDGYKVLVSTGSNEPFTDAFTDTLFVAAEMLTYPDPLTFNLNHYTFSPGYIHGNGYTLMDYFFLIKPDAPVYTGRLEPHQESLAKFAGQTIYIAFLHDSTNDLLLQIDDITIINGPTSGVFSPQTYDFQLRVRPNPVRGQAQLSWQFPGRQDARLDIRDVLGRRVGSYPVDLSAGNFSFDTSAFPAGKYSCTLSSQAGLQTIVLVKQ
ncbi:MAG: choice-of-anchor J domain-containing protein [Saprospiraceae bacterium]|nr:choice-of-anchor J domain-containing protein [Saprospiraceae bacterium]